MLMVYDQSRSLLRWQNGIGLRGKEGDRNKLCKSELDNVVLRIRWSAETLCGAH